jgi:hypothetical protein
MLGTDTVPIRISLPSMSIPIWQNDADPTGSTTLPELHKIKMRIPKLCLQVCTRLQVPAEDITYKHTQTHRSIHHNLTVVNVQEGGPISKLFKLHWNVCNPTRTLTAIRLNSKLSRRSLGLIFRPYRIANLFRFPATRNGV